LLEASEIFVIRIAFADYASQWLWELPSLNRLRGRAWNASTIQGSAKRASGMICNEVYRGVIVWNRVGKIRNPQTGRKVPRVNPRSEWQRIEAPHLRVVPEELWQETIARLAKARNANCGWVPPRRMLSGLLRCGACSSSIVSAGLQRGRERAHSWAKPRRAGRLAAPELRNGSGRQA
jgi:hypothetical protein